jgi:hypothetical protein
VARLQPIEDGALAYVDPGIDFRAYRRVMIAPMEILVPPGGTPLTDAQRRFVADSVRDALRAGLDVWSQALMVQSSPRHGGMRYGPSSSRLRPHDRGGPSRDPA